MPIMTSTTKTLILDATTLCLHDRRLCCNLCHCALQMLVNLSHGVLDILLKIIRRWLRS